uniref:Phosphatidylcholine 1-acylhydrolase n=1 Tax=uncultured Helicobacter sp. TaxID=175537 RepID=A0A650F3M6_9HELI|nr:phospholipase [uncultured Helicobacter sp.]
MRFKSFLIIGLGLMYFNVCVMADEGESQESSQITPQKSQTMLGDNQSRRIALYPHRSVYILPFYHSISAPTENNIRDETKFQFSFKLPVISHLFSPYGKFYFAYTQTAWFQNYNKKDSRPFRDLDYQPELFYSYERALGFLGGRFKSISAGYNHISNGEREARSRTENRLFVSANWEHQMFKNGVFGVQAMAWVYFGKHNNGFLHDNADLPKYRGYNDLWIYYKGSRHLLEFYARPVIARKYYPYFELGWTIRISKNMGLYAQYLNGWGDNIYEYNIRSQRVGVGLRLWNY